MFEAQFWMGAGLGDASCLPQRLLFQRDEFETACTETAPLQMTGPSPIRRPLTARPLHPRGHMHHSLEEVDSVEVHPWKSEELIGSIKRFMDSAREVL